MWVSLSSLSFDHDDDWDKLCEYGTRFRRRAEGEMDLLGEQADGREEGGKTYVPRQVSQLAQKIGC